MRELVELSGELQADGWEVFRPTPQTLHARRGALSIRAARAKHLSLELRDDGELQSAITHRRQWNHSRSGRAAIKRLFAAADLEEPK